MSNERRASWHYSQHFTDQNGQLYKEGREHLSSFEKLKRIGQDHLAHLQKDLLYSPDFLLRSRRFVAHAAFELQPKVWASFWEHVYLASLLGEEIVLQAQANNHLPQVNATTMAAVAYMHDVGRLVQSDGYFRNDLIMERLLKSINNPPLQEIFDTYTIPMRKYLELKKILMGKDMHEQNRIISAYFTSLTPEQRIFNVADNLGKRLQGRIFTLEDFEQYLITQETRYRGSVAEQQTITWPSIMYAQRYRRENGKNSPQLKVVQKTLHWLAEMGVDVGKIQTKLEPKVPKTIILMRHGEAATEYGHVYNLDNKTLLIEDKEGQIIETEDIARLVNEHDPRIVAVGETLKQRQFIFNHVFASPTIRTRQTAYLLAQGNGYDGEILPLREAREALAPLVPRWYSTAGSLYTWRELEKTLDANPDEQGVYRSFFAESSGELKARMIAGFHKVLFQTKPGEISAMVSHSSPIQEFHKWLYNELKLPAENHAPGPGAAEVIVVEGNEPLLAYYLREK